MSDKRCGQCKLYVECGRIGKDEDSLIASICPAFSSKPADKPQHLKVDELRKKLYNFPAEFDVRINVNGVAYPIKSVAHIGGKVIITPLMKIFGDN